MKRRPPLPPKRPQPTKPVVKLKVVVPPRAVKVAQLVRDKEHGLEKEKHAREVRNRVMNSPLAGVSWVRSFMDRVGLGSARDARALEDWLHTLREQAEQVARLHGALIALGQRILAGIAGPANSWRLWREVIVPARAGRADEATVWDVIDDMVGFDVRRRTREIDPRLTVCNARAGDMSAVVGREETLGLAGAAGRRCVLVHAQAIGFGAMAGGGVEAEVEFTPAAPIDSGGLTVGFDRGIAFGSGFGIGVGFAPGKLLSPGLADRWDFDSFSVSLPVGGEVESGAWLEYARVRPLHGPRAWLSGPAAPEALPRASARGNERTRLRV